MEVNLIKETKTKEGLYCILFSLLLGVAFDRLFIDKAFGVSYFIFIGLCIGFFLWSIRDSVKLQKSFGWFLLIPIALLSFSYTVYTNEIFYAINTLAVPVLMVASSILIANPETQWDKSYFIVEMLRKAVANVLNNAGKPYNIVKSSIKTKSTIHLKEGKKQILIGILISLPLLAVIMVLLSSADMVFGYYLANFTELFDNINIGEFVPHVVVAVVIAFYLFGYVWGFKNKNKAIEQNLNAPVVQWELVTIITVLVALNILYLIFTLIQFSYLYGGGSMTLPADFTYAEYARRGFFELAAVTVINFIIVLSCIKFIKKDNRKLLVAANILLSILIVFTINMLFSANFKLTMYENAFGFTYLRILVHLFMLLLFILCIVAVTGIWYRKIPIMKSIIVITIVMYTIINYINIDAFIAGKNIERYRATGKLDTLYITSLSFEAVPYMLELRNVDDNYIKTAIENNLKYRKEALDRQDSWSEFNFSKSKVRKLFNQGS